MMSFSCLFVFSLFNWLVRGGYISKVRPVNVHLCKMIENKTNNHPSLAFHPEESCLQDDHCKEDTHTQIHHNNETQITHEIKMI